MSNTAQLVLVAPEPRRRSVAPEQVVNVNVVPDERMLLTVIEAAHRLGIGRSSLYRLLDARQIRSIHVGRSHRIPVDALVEFVNQQTAEQ
jgi:excisionase family DNA binding protein